MGLGILLGLLGSIMINVGNNVQALGMEMDAAQKLEAAQSTEGTEAPQSKRAKVIWTMGTITFIVGSVINFVAFVFAAAAVLAPLEAIQFVSNLLFARFVTKKEVSRKMIAGSLLIVSGTVGAIASFPMAVVSFSIPQLKGFWESPTWIGYVVAAWCASLTMQVFWEMQTRRVKAGGKQWGPPALMPILYAASSALIGTQSVVQAKAFSELMELWLGQGVLIWVEWFTYVVLGYFLVTVAFWLYRLNAALGKYEPIYIIPLLQASYIVLATVAGGLYFQEFAQLEWWQLLAFFGCIGVMFVGLYLLIPPITGAAPPHEEPTQEEGSDLPAKPVASFVRLSSSVSYANATNLSFRPPGSPGALREGETRRRSSVNEAAGFYGGAGAGLSITPSFRTRSGSRRPSRAQDAVAISHLGIGLGEGSGGRTQLATLTETSERGPKTPHGKASAVLTGGSPPSAPPPPPTEPPPSTGSVLRDSSNLEIPRI